jgi:hypothetical protein
VTPKQAGDLEMQLHERPDTSALPRQQGRLRRDDFPTFARRLRPDGVVETLVKKPLSPKETTDCVHNLQHYSVDNKLFEIVRCEEDSIFDAATRHSYETIEAALIILGNLDAAYVAFVAENDLTFGMCRQLAMRIDAPSVKLSVFRDPESAEAWLRDNR